jgi:IS5 family transposase
MTSTPCAGRDRGHHVPHHRRYALVGGGQSSAGVAAAADDLARVDPLLDDPAFFEPFAPHFHPVLGRPSTPAECYLRLMFLKFRHRLGYESLCAEGSDSISWRRFCRIPLDGKVPHPPR